MDRYTLIVAMTVSSARWQRRFGDPLARAPKPLFTAKYRSRCFNEPRHYRETTRWEH
jgi:hypothetical protein